MSVFLPMAALLGGGGVLDVADVFSTDLYVGDTTSVVVTNGVDLVNNDGLIWFKNRSAAQSHRLLDTLRGNRSSLVTDSTSAAGNLSSDTFNYLSDGFSIGFNTDISTNGNNYAAWTFRQASKFFDVVTYAGNGTKNTVFGSATNAGRTIPHSLDGEIGAYIVKRTDGTGDWLVAHRGDGERALFLNKTDAALAGTGQLFGDNSTFSPGSNRPATTGEFNTWNASGETYVAYLFAHDTSDSGIIQCGSYTGNGSATGPTVTLGWEPQWLLVKSADGARNWVIIDSARGAATSGNTRRLFPDSSAAEDTINPGLGFISTGFEIGTTNVALNAAETYIYMAVRSES